MPQLDRVTYVSQYFWLCFFFLGFFSLSLKKYLPQFSRILALRQKKIGLQDDVLSLHQENQNVQKKSTLIFSNGLTLSKKTFGESLSRAKMWSTTNALSLNQTHYGKVNAFYTTDLGKSLVFRSLAEYHCEKNFPEDMIFQKVVQSVENKKNQFTNLVNRKNQAQSFQDEIEVTKGKKTKK